MNNKIRKYMIGKLNKQIASLQNQVAGLRRGCIHKIVKRHSSAICNICGDNFGWYCQDSPDKLCLYKQPPGSIFYEYTCVYCGLPEERK